MQTRFAAFFLLMACSTPILGATDGNQLLQMCSAAVCVMDGVDKNGDFDAALCIGFIGGYKSGHDNALRGMTHCAPNNITAGQLVRITVKYLNEHPEQLHLDQSVLTAFALAQAFPCGKK